jgi:hypothetical protein
MLRRQIDLGDTRYSCMVMVVASWVATNVHLLPVNVAALALCGWVGMWFSADRLATVIAFLFGAFVMGYTMFQVCSRI